MAMARPAILGRPKNFQPVTFPQSQPPLRPNRLGFDELPTPPAPSSAIPSAAETIAANHRAAPPAAQARLPQSPSAGTVASPSSKLGRMAAPAGDPGRVRIINGHEIVFGERSKCDAKSWPCECGKTNEPRRMLIFDIPRFHCYGCGKPFPGDFDICLGNVRVNGIPIMGDLKCQKPYEDECIAYALAYLCEMIYKIDCALNSEKPDIEVVKSIRMKPSILYTPFNKMFDNLKIPTPGIHKLLRLCQKLRQQGALFELHQKKAAKQNSFSFQMGENQIVHSFDFEEVCEQIADGNPLIATLTTGSDYPDLKFCEFYTGVPTLEFNIQLARNRTVASHVVLLIGAASIRM